MNIGSVYIIIAALLWAFDGVLRRSLYALPPSIIVFYEHLIGAVLISPFLVKYIQKVPLTRKIWSAVIWVSLLSGLLGTLFFTAALVKTEYISFSVVFLLQKLQPVFAVITAKYLLGEKMTKEYVKWAILAMVAAYFVTFQNGHVFISQSKDTLYAALLALGAAFAWGTSTAVSRYGLKKLPYTYMTGLRFIMTVPLAFLAVIVLGNTDSLGVLTLSQIVRLVVIACSTGLVALWVYYKGLARVEAKVSTILELVYPVVAVIIDVFYYNTVLAVSQYIAAGVMLFVIYKVTKLHTKM